MSGLNEQKDVSGKRLDVGDRIATIFTGGRIRLEVVTIRSFTKFKIGVIDAAGNYRTKFPCQVSLVEKGATL